MAKPQTGRPEAPAAHGQAPLCTVLLVLALPEELEYLYDVMEERGGWDVGFRLPLNICTYETAQGPIQVIVTVLKGMGPVEAALGTAAGITEHSPGLVVMIGLAGGLDHDRIGLGDVVLSNRAKLYTVDKVAAPGSDKVYRFRGTGDDLRNRPGNEVWVDPRDRFMDQSHMRYLRDVVQGGYTDQLLASVQNELRNCELAELKDEWIPKSFKALPPFNRKRTVTAGWILGSTHVVDSGEYRRYLLDKNADTSGDIYAQTGVNRGKWEDGNLLAVDMESYALLRAVNEAMARPSYKGGCENLAGGLLVRGISDMCEEKADLDAATGKAVRRLAVENATKVGLALIENLDYRRFFPKN